MPTRNDHSGAGTGYHNVMAGLTDYPTPERSGRVFTMHVHTGTDSALSPDRTSLSAAGHTVPSPGRCLRCRQQWMQRTS